MRHAWLLLLTACATSTAAPTPTPPEAASPTKLQQAAELYKQAKAAGANRALATEKLNAALAIEPNFPQALAMRGEIAREAGNLDAAEADFTRALAACTPKRKSLYRFLRASFYHQSKRDFVRAEEDYFEAVRLENEHPTEYQVDILMHRALLYLDTNRPRDAIADYETILSKNPDDRTKDEVIEWYAKAHRMQVNAASPKQP